MGPTPLHTLGAASKHRAKPERPWLEPIFSQKGAVPGLRHRRYDVSQRLAELPAQQHVSQGELMAPLVFSLFLTYPHVTFSAIPQALFGVNRTDR